MTRRRLLRHLDTARIEDAIAHAETKTSGEIRVSIVGFFRGDLNHLGERAFQRLGMTATRHRNGVLILLAPTRRKVMILGDVGIQSRVDNSFWPGLAESLALRFKDRDFTGGLADAVDGIGRELAIHFPPDSTANINELSDAVDVGAGRTRGERP
jgi:uncharacterized membrane protein